MKYRSTICFLMILACAALALGLFLSPAPAKADSGITVTLLPGKAGDTPVTGGEIVYDSSVVGIIEGLPEVGMEEKGKFYRDIHDAAMGERPRLFC